MTTEERQEIRLPFIQVSQPLGDFYLAKISHNVLCDITFTDVRRMEKEREFETYLGIQRPLSEKRVKEIKQYVRTEDACFPSNVILSIAARCVREEKGGACSK